MATPSSILAQETPWTKGPGGLQSMGLQEVRHDWATNALGRCSISEFLNLPPTSRQDQSLRTGEAMSPGCDGESGWSLSAGSGALHWLPWRCSWTWLVTQCPPASPAEVHGWETWGLVLPGSQSQCTGWRGPMVPLVAPWSSVPQPWPCFPPGLDWLPVQGIPKTCTNQQGRSTDPSEQVLH